MNYKVEKDFEYRGIHCVVLGLKMGHRCGYVAIPKTSKLYKSDLDTVDVSCHGGVTYGRESSVYPVKSDAPTAWIGFDCAHCGDGQDVELMQELGADEGMIKIMSQYRFNSDIVRTAEYCENECKGIVDQMLEDKS